MSIGQKSGRQYLDEGLQKKWNLTRLQEQNTALHKRNNCKPCLKPFSHPNGFFLLTNYFNLNTLYKYCINLVTGPRKIYCCWRIINIWWAGQVLPLSSRRQQQKSAPHWHCSHHTAKQLEFKEGGGGGGSQNKNFFFNFNDYAEKAKMGSIGKVCSATCLWHLHINIAIKKLKSILEFPVIFTRSETKEAARLSPTFATDPAFRAK